ncbi:MAG: nucleotidyltransferase family protein, partial [Clostridia bacterium]|nr:nucleotidyltransferase family protein [Clostridia bacterium]
SLETSERVLHSFAILNGEDISLAFDSNEEIASLIVKEAKNYDSELFLDALRTKNYTKARLKRALLYALFNIENVDFSPKFTILLGTDSVGRTIAKKTVLGFTIITKHSDASKMSEKEKSILETVYSVDQIHGLMLKKASVPSDAYKRRPIIKKDSTD